MPPTFSLSDIYRREHTFILTQPGVQQPALPALYAFIRDLGGQNLLAGISGMEADGPFYIGQTGDVSKRFDDHHKWPDAVGAYKANAIGICHFPGTESVRIAAERALIEAYSPPLNELLVPKPLVRNNKLAQHEQTKRIRIKR